MLSYDGNNHFTLLTARDERVFTHRDRFEFRRN